MQALRTLIIDDERLARRASRHLLEACEAVDVIGEASGISEAKQQIERLQPDLILLDIEMPGGRGIDILSELSHRPMVILVTAHEVYALEAFDLDVVDYVLKPIDPERLERALDRVVSRMARRRVEQKEAQKPSFENEDASGLSPVGSGKTFVDCEQVLAVFADGNYTQVLFKNGKEEFIRQSMRQWEQQLNGDPFLRINRKMIINLREISALKLSSHEAYFYLNGCSTRFTVGRNAAAKLKILLDG